jgi:hypothetical protein
MHFTVPYQVRVLLCRSTVIIALCKWLPRVLTLAVSEASRRALEASILGYLGGLLRWAATFLCDERVTGVCMTPFLA